MPVIWTSAQVQRFQVLFLRPETIGPSSHWDPSLGKVVNLDIYMQYKKIYR